MRSQGSRWISTEYSRPSVRYGWSPIKRSASSTPPAWMMLYPVQLSRGVTGRPITVKRTPFDDRRSLVNQPVAQPGEPLWPALVGGIRWCRRPDVEHQEPVHVVLPPGLRVGSAAAGPATVLNRRPLEFTRGPAPSPG